MDFTNSVTWAGLLTRSEEKSFKMTERFDVNTINIHKMLKSYSQKCRSFF